MSIKNYDASLASYKEAASCIFEIVKITTDDKTFNATLKN